MSDLTLGGLGAPCSEPDHGDVPSSCLRIAVRAEGFNPRHIQLDGSNLALDLREALYGAKG